MTACTVTQLVVVLCSKLSQLHKGKWNGGSSARMLKLRGDAFKHAWVPTNQPPPPLPEDPTERDREADEVKQLRRAWHGVARCLQGRATAWAEEVRCKHLASTCAHACVTGHGR